MRMTDGQQHRSNLASRNGRGLSWSAAGGPPVPSAAPSNPLPATSLRAVSGRVKNRNTPESDISPLVEHILTLSDNTEVTVWATDPLAAITDYNRRVSRGV